MNRLWVRISFIITIVLIFGMLLPLMIGIAMREFNLNENPPPPEPPEDLGPAEFRARIEDGAPRFFPGWFVLRNLIPQLIGITLISILVGAGVAWAGSQGGGTAMGIPVFALVVGMALAGIDPMGGDAGYGREDCSSLRPW